MRTIHRRKHGKSMLKIATKPKPRFVRDNTHAKQVIPAKLVKIELEDTKDVQNEGPSRIERILPGKGMMRMDDPGMARALTAKIPTIRLTPLWNDLVKT